MFSQASGQPATMMGETKQMVLLKGIELPNSSLEHDETSEKHPTPVSVMPQPKVTPTPPPATPPPQPTPPPMSKITTPISTANPSTPITGPSNVPNNHPPMSTPNPVSQVPQVPPKIWSGFLKWKAPSSQDELSLQCDIQCQKPEQLQSCNVDKWPHNPAILQIKFIQQSFLQALKSYFTNSTMLNFNFQQSHALGQLHQTLTSSNIPRGTPQAGLVQLYKDQNNIIHTLIIVYAKNNKFMGLLPNNPSGFYNELLQLHTSQRQQAQRNQIPQPNQPQPRPNGGQPGVPRPNGVAQMQPNQPMVSTNQSQPVTSHMSMNSQGQGPPISMHSNQPNMANMNTGQYRPPMSNYMNRSNMGPPHQSMANGRMPMNSYPSQPQMNTRPNMMPNMQPGQNMRPNYQNNQNPQQNEQLRNLLMNQGVSQSQHPIRQSYQNQYS